MTSMNASTINRTNGLNNCAPACEPDLPAIYGEHESKGLIAVPKADFWIFGYGSLIWNPGFAFAEAVNARVYGYHRRFCIASTIYRGTPDNPGLVLGLRRGGMVHGRAFRVRARDAEAVLDYLERRELRVDAYEVKWPRALLADGRRVETLTFVLAKHSSVFACCKNGQDLPIGEVIRRLGECVGPAGSNREYLDNLCAHLKASGIKLGKLGSLQRKVEAHYPKDRPIDAKG